MIPGKTQPLQLTAAERPTALPCFGGHTLPMWSFADGAWPPVIRLRLGERLNVMLENRLPRPDEYTSIHWHGCRLPNNQDGVPYLVQKPVLPGEKFHYDFMPPDTGTFFFHTHCNTAEQLGRGLQGVVIVDGDTTEPYDADIVLFIRDWQVDLATGQWNPFVTLRGAGRAGTYGPVRSVNGAVNPEFKLARLRRLSAATDQRRSDPCHENRHRRRRSGDHSPSTGLRCSRCPSRIGRWDRRCGSTSCCAPRRPGKTARLIDQSMSGRVELAHFTGIGEPRSTSDFDPAPLHAVRITEPDLDTATRLDFAFERTDDGQMLALVDNGPGDALGALCVSSHAFWAINDRSWPDHDHARIPPPLALLDRGQSYVFVLKNKSPFTHPIHIHGHTFKLISSDKLSRPEHHTDTLLLLPDETAEVAFVADNPGNWMFHCHIIEHQENGMMGYLRVG